MVLKYNRLVGQCADLKDASDTANERLRKVTTKYRDYKAWGHKAEVKLAEYEAQAIDQSAANHRLIGEVDKLTAQLHAALTKAHAGPGAEATATRTSPQVAQSPAEAKSDSPKLPSLRNDDEAILDTQFVAIVPHSEPHSSSSTDGITSSPPQATENTQPSTRVPSSRDTDPQSMLPQTNKRKVDQVSETPSRVDAKIKVEVLSSSPPVVTALSGASQNLDLDEIGKVINTPRKKQRISDVTSNTSRDAEPKSMPRIAAPPLRQSSRIALQTRDANAIITPTSKAQQKAITSRRRDGIAAIAEDGDLFTKATTVADSERNTLQRLLTMSAPPKVSLKSLPRSPRTPKRQRASILSRETDSSEASTLPRGMQPAVKLESAETDRTNRGKTHMNRSTNLQDNATATSPSTKTPQRIRDKPRANMTLEDFKVNPNYNQGYDYAFNDVVRNHDDRRCLQGCTKPECCGTKFMIMAASERDPHVPLTASQQQDDDRRIREYLGTDAWKLRDMSKPERDHFWLLTRARELANKHGRHRHAYERRKTPPGFWDADFPTTQEHEERRILEAQYERELVDVRYGEAVRGGAYLFRDEL